MFLISRLSIVMLIASSVVLTFSAIFFQSPKIKCIKYEGDFVITVKGSSVILVGRKEAASTITIINGENRSEQELSSKGWVVHPVNRWSNVTFFSGNTIYTVTREPVLFTDTYLAAFTFLLGCLITSFSYLLQIIREFLNDSRDVYLEYSDKLIELESAKRRRTGEEKCTDEIDKENKLTMLYTNIVQLGDKHLTSKYAESIREKIELQTRAWIDNSKTKNQRHTEVRNILESRVGLFKLFFIQ